MTQVCGISLTALVLLTLALVSPAGADIRVIDGDTVKVDGQSLRLTSEAGPIDAPESGRRARCPLELYRAQAAKDRLTAIVAKGVEITDTGEQDRWKRPIVILRQNGKDVGALLVLEGHARPWPTLRKKDRPTWCGQ